MRTDDGYVEWLMRRYGVCRANAEDILQASLLRLAHDYRAKHPNASEAELQAYLDTLPEGVLYRTLHWQACNWLRARRREQTTLACWMQQRPCEDDPEQAAVERVYAEWLASLLPDGAQEIHALLEAGYTWDEIATQLGVRLSAAKMRFQRGVTQVRQQLGLGCDDLAVCGVNRDGGRKTGVAPAENQMEVHDEVVTPLSSDDAYRSETLPNSKYDRSNLSPSQDSYADNDAQTNNPQHAHANTDANATSCAQTHTIPQPHPTNTPASQTHASCASNSSDDPAAPRSTAPREPHTDTLSATPTHNAPPHPPPCPDNDA
jgi:DNA-directed RNA polymerase specialized sigma24 family protein